MPLRVRKTSWNRVCLNKGTMLNLQKSLPKSPRGKTLDEKSPDGYHENRQTRAVPDPTETIVGLIQTQARIHPERLAIIDGEVEIDFRRLIEKADTIAGELNARGVKPGSLVGVCMDRTWQLVATLLGVLRAGCAYVPLDPTYPKERVRYMLEHSGVVATLVGDEKAARLCEAGSDLLWVDEITDRRNHEVVGPSPNDLAYVIYTSGSTGKPKGVAVEHRNVVAMSHAMGMLLDDEELSGVLAAASVCFDTSVMETLGTLSLGGTIVLAENALELPNLPLANKVKTCVMVPSAMQALLSSAKLPEGLRSVVLGGEALKLSLANQIHALNRGLRLVNAYGPTEDTVFSTTVDIPPGVDVVTIGKSVANSRSYILDEAMQPVPDGTAGELYLAGSKLARGYLHDKDLTEKRFVEMELEVSIPETRLYKTGDLCCRRENGEIEFQGRADQQVKIRGFRIEIGEIESTLESMDGVKAAAAAALVGPVGQKILAVYVVRADAAVTEETVKSYLAEWLPGYMVPQAVMFLKALPLLPNDKLNRDGLPCFEDVQKAGALSPTRVLDDWLTGDTDQQRSTILSTIQKEVAALLSVDDPKQFSQYHSFDSFGLDSLTVLELGSRLSEALGRPLPTTATTEHSTPAALVDHVLSLTSSEGAKASTGKALETTDTLSTFQAHIRSSHPTFQAAKVPAWSISDKAKVVQELTRMVNERRRNPYSKVIRTGSASRGTVSDVYADEEQEAIIWTTNLYLGLNRDSTVIEKSRRALERFGTGMGTSAAASGLTDTHVEFETAFADLVGKPSACLFPTGYTANVGVIAGVVGPNDVVVVDQLCHASIVDGARLSGAKVRTFQHNNASDLEEVLKTEMSPYHTVLVALEGVYSMGEGTAPVAEITRMAKKYGALVLVDEAHSFGFYGPRGAGICADQGVTEDVDFIMTTLSKALGSLGGVIAASTEHVELLKASARAYIFRASVSPADIAAALAALRRLRSDDALRKRLWDTTRYMRQRFSEAGYDLGTGDGPIVTPHFADKDKLYAIVQGLYERGVQTSAVTYPIVESGRGRLRFICSASHTRDDVDTTLEALLETEREVDERLSTAQNASTGRRLGLADVEDWATTFVDYVADSMATTLVPVPDLAVSVVVADGEIPVTITITEQTVTLGSSKETDVPSCSLFLKDNNAVTALCLSTVEELLHSICSGGCALAGQVEPFIWFVGRLVDHQQTITCS